MKKILLYAALIIIINSCTSNETRVDEEYENMIMLRTDTVNVVKLSDSLIIYENACRGCAYEESTHFDIIDSTGTIQLAKVVTTDDNASDMDGGSISKDLILVPVKPGITTIKLYKFISENPSAKDSSFFTTYSIEVRN